MRFILLFLLLSTLFVYDVDSYLHHHANKTSHHTRPKRWGYGNGGWNGYGGMYRPWNMGYGMGMMPWGWGGMWG
uniref:Uncharacterized protein n=1 Tax=Steinernema glaseri TaxID=37863 RepID=A0A1I7ZKZ4_9BILA